MKFTAFVLAAAATSATAQSILSGFGYQPTFQTYQFQQPVQYQYPIQQTAPVDPLQWERDCTWINGQQFHNALLLGTCGTTSQVYCATPNGNGGGTRTLKGSTSSTGNQVWASVVNRAGRVCAVTYTGFDVSQQFPYGRLLSMKLANTANSLSMHNRAATSHVRFYDNSVMSGSNAEPKNFMVTKVHTTDRGYAQIAANEVYDFEQGDGAATAVGGSNETQYITGRSYNFENNWAGFTLPSPAQNPGDITVHYQGAASNYGQECGGRLSDGTTRQDPMCMQKPGGFMYSAGGLALYDYLGVFRGAIGVAGDNDCSNHLIAWKTRQQLNMDFTPGSENEDRNDDWGLMNDHTASPNAFYNGNNLASIEAVLTGLTAATGLLSDDQQEYIATKTTGDVHWAGKFAEDNVIFPRQEIAAFPKCQQILQSLYLTNPTRENPMYQSWK